MLSEIASTFAPETEPRTLVSGCLLRRRRGVAVTRRSGSFGLRRQPLTAVRGSVCAVAIVMGMALSAFATDRGQEIKLWTNGAPGSEGITAEEVSTPSKDAKYAG